MISRSLLFAFLVLAAALAAWSACGPVPGHMAACQAVFGVASGAWLFALWRLGRLRRNEAGPRGTGRHDLAFVVAGAIALRLVILTGDPQLSDDVHRYVWEGALVAQGTSPYAHAPAAPERAVERARWPELYGRINHPDVSAAYPPLAQLAFAAVVFAAGGPDGAEGGSTQLALRIAFASADLAVLLALIGLLRARGEDPRWCLAWGWSPLVASEFAGGAHYDSLAIALLVVGLLAWQRGRARSAAALLAAGGLVKLAPLVGLPWIVRGPGGALRAALALFTLGIGGAWVLLLDGGALGLGAGLTEYGLRWESTSALYRFVEPLLESLLGAGFARDRSLSDPRLVGRATCAVIWGTVALVEWRRRSDPATAVTRLVRTALVLAPTLHPWYLTWSVPFLACLRSRSWALLGALAPLLYWPLAGWSREGVWREPGWLWPTVFLPFFALWIWDAWRGWPRRPGWPKRRTRAT